MRSCFRRWFQSGLISWAGAIEEFDREPGTWERCACRRSRKKDIDTWLKGRNPFNHMSVMFDRRMVEQAGGYEPFPWMEDYWLWARMIAGDCRCANVPDVLVDVRTGEGMYARRSNGAYLKSQVCFFSGCASSVWSAAPGRRSRRRTRSRHAAADGLVKLMYNKLLRTKVGDCRGR